LVPYGISAVLTLQLAGSLAGVGGIFEIVIKTTKIRIYP
jgi:hypothetical protein